jgi:hypothetical protein
MFADLFADIGRRSVPPSVVAAVMVLQRLEGLSDREATDRFTFDVRWRYAAGVGGWDSPAHRVSFVHTVALSPRPPPTSRACSTSTASWGHTGTILDAAEESAVCLVSRSCRHGERLGGGVDALSAAGNDRCPSRGRCPRVGSP